MRHAEPTGRWRYRSARAWRGAELLILQIEERGLLTTYVAGGSDTQWVTHWRDAATADLALDDAKDRRQTRHPKSRPPHEIRTPGRGEGDGMNDDTVVPFPAKATPLGMPARAGDVASDLDPGNPLTGSLRGMLSERRALVQRYGWGDGSVKEIERAIADRLATLAGDSPIENPA